MDKPVQIWYNGPNETESAMRPYSRVTITKKNEESIKGGHVWVFRDEITGSEGPLKDGDLVDVVNSSNRYLGTGFYNSKSVMTVRILSKNSNDLFDEAFWLRRLTWVIRYRMDTMGPEDFRCCRLIFGEADQFPGLTVDRYEDVLVVQIVSLGFELRKETILSLLIRVLKEEFSVAIRVVYLRNEHKLRVPEGLTQEKGYYCGEENDREHPGTVEITENGLRYTVDFMNGQKTGFFLDQKYNRLSIRKICRGKAVLDCFTHTGSFALNAAAAGATHVTAVDISEEALRRARENAAINGLESRIEFMQADVFDYLKSMEGRHDSAYDVIILDPPAFTKGHESFRNAFEGYKKINAQAMRLLRRGSYLVTCSCSNFMSEPNFKMAIHHAAELAHVSLRQIEGRKQSPDHPILWNVPETDYLKFFLFQVV